MPSWAAPSPTTQATDTKASKVFCRVTAMVGQGETGWGWMGCLLPSLHLTKGQKGPTTHS